MVQCHALSVTSFCYPEDLFYGKVCFYSNLANKCLSASGIFKLVIDTLWHYWLLKINYDEIYNIFCSCFPLIYKFMYNLKKSNLHGFINSYLNCENVHLRALWSSRRFLIAQWNLFTAQLGLHFVTNKQTPND